MLFALQNIDALSRFSARGLCDLSDLARHPGDQRQARRMGTMGRALGRVPKWLGPLLMLFGLTYLAANTLLN
jgi:hypothetical protein